MMYSKLKGKEISEKGMKLKQYHHVWLDSEFVKDCHTWLWFLNLDGQGMCCPFTDFSREVKVNALDFYSDASKNPLLGFRAYYQTKWLYRQWDSEFIKHEDLGIEFLELYVLTFAVLQWGNTLELQNARIAVYCDNEAVVHMVNKNASACSKCMKLIRLLALDNLKNNQRLTVIHVRSKENRMADALIRLDLNRFWRLAPYNMNQFPVQTLPMELWPMQKIWFQS